ncbi:hypothetical protein QQ045_004085 [Rhodiola kirilowii]
MVSSAILGLTVLAWGNSLRDLLASSTVASNSGPGELAPQGCYAGLILKARNRHQLYDRKDYEEKDQKTKATLYQVGVGHGLDRIFRCCFFENHSGYHLDLSQDDGQARFHSLTVMHDVIVLSGYFLMVYNPICSASEVSALQDVRMFSNR